MKYHAGIVQYEADIILPQDFWFSKKRQTQDVNEQLKIDDLILSVCHYIYVCVCMYVCVHVCVCVCTCVVYMDVCI